MQARAYTPTLHAGAELPAWNKKVDVVRTYERLSQADDSSLQ